ncbi:MAG: G5 domain-containing protein [Coprobacillaceae bacterium]
MKQLKKAIIEADSRMKGILVIMVAYLAIVATSFTVGAASEIKDYIQTVDIQVQDGDQPTKDYLVRQDKVGNVLTELNIILGEKDLINKDLNYIVNKGDLLSITRIGEIDIEEYQEVGYSEIHVDGLQLFTTKVAQTGQSGQVKNTYHVTYHNGQEVSREIIGSEVITEAKDTIIEHGTLQVGSYFTGRLTTYGGDCNGCSGSSATGISLSSTTGVNGSNTAKLTYNGESYYCLAADASIPFGTIIKISNHNLGIEDVAYGIVVDRGGAIKGNKIDIYQGSESGGVRYFSGGTSLSAEFEIVSIGNGSRNFWK